MSIKLMNLIWSDNTGRLNGIETAILLKMADHAADDGSSIYPSLTTLCKTTKFSKSAVTRSIKSLIDKRLLVCVRPGKAKHQTTIYRIDVKNLEEVPKTIEKPKVIHKKTVYKLNCILRGYSHCILRGYSHCTLREPPSLIITTMYKGTNTVGFEKPVDKSKIPIRQSARQNKLLWRGKYHKTEVPNEEITPEQALSLVNFLLGCKSDGMEISRDLVKFSHERYRGLVGDQLLDKLAA